MAYLREPLILEAVGGKLKDIRRRKNMSQSDVASRAGIAVSQVGRIERGLLNPSISTLFVIALALEVEPKEIFDFDELFVKKNTSLTSPAKSNVSKKAGSKNKKVK